jgi:AraC-like DNA-binding protein
MQLFLPQPDLRDAVECAVLVQRAAGSTSCFPAMPRAMLTVALAAGSTATVGFHTMTTRAAAYVHDEPLHALGLVLQPHTAARVLGISTGALVDATLPWAELAGAGEAARLDYALQQARSDAARLEALQSSLRRVLARGSERVQRARADSLQQLCWAVGRQGVQAAGTLGLGERQLERHCLAVLGMSPKQMQRITRWHGLLCGVLHRQRLPDAGAALESGYYDQSHLARESRQLAGTTMRELLRQAHAGSAWWPLEAQRLQDRLRG